MTTAMDNLPPEMKARLAEIMAQRTTPSTAESPHQAAIAQPQPAPQPQPPAPKPPSLMDHVIALRQEVAMLNQQVTANSQVVEAVGNAVGSLYAMFQPSAQGNAPGQTYSETFQQSVDESDY